MLETTTQNITATELSPTNRTKFEHLITQFREILTQNNAQSTKELINTNTPTKDIKQAVELLKQIKHFKQDPNPYKPNFSQEKDDELNDNLEEVMRETDALAMWKFNEGRARITINGRKCFIKQDKTRLQTPNSTYKFAFDFQEGRAAVSYDGLTWYFIKHDGSYLSHDEYTTASSFREGRAIVSQQKDEDDKYFFIKHDGTRLNNKNYDEIEQPFIDGVAIARKDGKRIFINHDGTHQ